MDKKNVIFLLIDACNADYLGQKKYKPTNSPFLDELSRHSAVFTNLYSSGPYTESAMIELMCGYRCLDNYSFIENLKYAPKTLLEAMKDSGYYTSSVIMDYVNFSSFRRGVDREFILMPPSLTTIWNGRLRFYAEMYKAHRLPNEKIPLIKSLLQEYFDQYHYFLTQVIEKKNTVQYMFISNEKYEMMKNHIQILEKEAEIFKNNSYDYLIGLLEKGKKHILFSIEYGDSWQESDKMKLAINEMIEKYADTINKMRQLQIKGNNDFIGHKIKNLFLMGRLIVSRVIKLLQERTFTVHKFKDVVGMVVLEFSIYNDYVINKVFKNIQNLQIMKYIPCARDQFNMFLDWYDTQYTYEKPFFSYLHIDDIHVNPIPFSYTDDKSILSEEFEYMKSYVDSLPSHYHGNIMYDVAIHHIDKKIEQFYHQLKKRNLLDNTIFIVTSDHGYYYAYDSFRLDSIGNMHRENYHIPLIWYDSNRAASCHDGLYAQRDLPYTLAEEAGILPDESWQGVNLFKNRSRDMILCEYPGRGSPDIEWKELYFGCFNHEYKVFVKVKLYDILTRENIVEIYCIKDDPYERMNLVKKLKYSSSINSLYSCIENRFSELQKMYKVK